MEINKIESIIESVLFAAGREVSLNELKLVLEIDEKDIEGIIEKMQEEYNLKNRGIQIVHINDKYQLARKKENYEYI